jgi:putative ABC transport system permease protein
MKAPDLLELAARNLRESVLRNSLTMLGIGVGVASLVAMLSLGIGLQQMATRRLERSGLFDTVMVTRADLNGFGPRRRNASSAGNQRALDESARRDISALPGVLEAVPDIRTVAQIAYDNKPHRAMIAAVPMSAHDREAFESIQGSFFSSGNAPEAILQKSFAEELLNVAPEASDGSNTGKPSPVLQPLLGKELVMSYAARISTPNSNSSPAVSGATNHTPAPPRGSLAPPKGTSASMDPLLAAFSVVPQTRTLRVVGILTEDPDAIRGLGRARAFLPQDFAEGLQLMLPSDLGNEAGVGERTYLEISVRVRNTRDVLPVESAIRRMGLNAFSILDASQNMQRAFAIFDLFLGVFGSLALAVASLGIVNTLVMAILERRREIGILKALGASDMDVKLLFFVEAGAMGLVGGMLGVAMGWTIGKLINAGTNYYLSRQNLPPETFWLVPWWLVFVAVGFSIFVSFLSGLYPAARAAKLDPVKALRYE